MTSSDQPFGVDFFLLIHSFSKLWLACGREVDQKNRACISQLEGEDKEKEAMQIHWQLDSCEVGGLPSENKNTLWEPWETWIRQFLAWSPHWSDPWQLSNCFPKKRFPKRFSLRPAGLFIRSRWNFTAAAISWKPWHRRHWAFDARSDRRDRRVQVSAAEGAFLAHVNKNQDSGRRGIEVETVSFEHKNCFLFLRDAETKLTGVGKPSEDYKNRCATPQTEKAVCLRIW